MKTKLLNLWGSIRSSFWFIPVLMVFSAIGVSALMIAVDNTIKLDGHRILGFIYAGGPEGARSVLSTIAGSMITIAGVTFSITIVTLTLASSQFGPRLLRNFMQDTGNQVVLGTFIATFIYCLLVLRSVHTAGNLAFVPSLSVTFAVVLALANVGILIYFIHHVSTSIQADRVVAVVYGELSEHLQRLFPEKLENGPEKSDDNRESPSQPREDHFRRAKHIEAPESGYLQAVDMTGLLEIAREKDVLMRIEYRPGDFVVAGSPLVTIPLADLGDQDLVKHIVNSFIVGAQCTPEQDAEFAIHQLVDVAMRALSPGINDPFTAITCIDWLGAALCYLTDRTFPSPYHYDDEGNLRLIARVVTFEGIANVAFDQIRQYGRSSVAVTMRLLETLHMIAVQTRCPEQRQAILRQAMMIRHASHESLPGERDRENVQERYQALLAVLNERDILTNPSPSHKKGAGNGNT